MLPLLTKLKCYFSGIEGFRKNPFELRIALTDIVEIHHKAGMLFGSITVTGPEATYQFKNVLDRDLGLGFAELLRLATSRTNRVATVLGIEAGPAAAPPSPDPSELTRRGIEASRAGDTSLAEQLFRQALRLDPRNELAWLWMSGVVSSNAERRQCLEKVLAINPHNSLALRGLEKLRSAGEPKPEGGQIPQPLPVRGEVTPAPGSFCPSCGQRTELGSRFCRHCGANLLGTVVGVSLRQAATEPAQAPPPQTEEVIVKEAGVHLVRKGPSDWVSDKKLIVTSRRVIWRSGLLDKKEEIFLLSRVTNVSVRYTLAGRAMGYGTVIIHAGSAELVAEDIVDAEGVKAAILNQLK